MSKCTKKTAIAIGCHPDDIEFMMAGATGVAVGAMNFVNPYTTKEVVDGIENYMDRYAIENLSDIIGCVK